VVMCVWLCGDIEQNDGRRLLLVLVPALKSYRAACYRQMLFIIFGVLMGCLCLVGCLFDCWC